MKLNSDEKGQSLFEVIIALAVSTIIIVSLVALVSNSIRNSTFSKNKTLASRYAQETTEWLRGQRDTDISAFITHALTPTWCLTELNWNISQIAGCSDGDEIAGTIFKREVRFTSYVLNNKNVVRAEVSVFWDDAQGSHEINNSTDFSDWRER